MELGEATYLILIPAMWCLLTWLLSRISGWHRLAARYRAADALSVGKTEQYETARMRTGRIGPVNYHSCLSFRVSESGLRIAVALPLRLGHPPLFIPWDEFHHVAEDSIMYSHKVRMSIGHPTLLRVTFPGWVRYRMPIEIRPKGPVRSEE